MAWNPFHPSPRLSERCVETLPLNCKILKQGNSRALGLYINLPNFGPANRVFDLKMTGISRLQPQSLGQRKDKEKLLSTGSQKGDPTDKVCENAIPFKLKEPDFH